MIRRVGLLLAPWLNTDDFHRCHSDCNNLILRGIRYAVWFWVNQVYISYVTFCDVSCSVVLSIGKFPHFSSHSIKGFYTSTPLFIFLLWISRFTLQNLLLRKKSIKVSSFSVLKSLDLGNDCNSGGQSGGGSSTVEYFTHWISFSSYGWGAYQSLFVLEDQWLSWSSGCYSWNWYLQIRALGFAWLVPSTFSFLNPFFLLSVLLYYWSAIACQNGTFGQQ